MLGTVTFLRSLDKEVRQSLPSFSELKFSLSSVPPTSISDEAIIQTLKSMTPVRFLQVSVRV